MDSDEDEHEDEEDDDDVDPVQASMDEIDVEFQPMALPEVRL
jgi:hypothetical protein